MAAAGIALRTIQEWMGHKGAETTEVCADYQPDRREAELVERAFGRAGINPGINLRESESNSEVLKPHQKAEPQLS